MTLQEFYSRLGCDYQAMFKHIPSQQMIRKFLLLYEQDTTVANLQRCVEACDWPEAFQAAHTLKGIALNLGLSPLAAAASTLTETLRGGKPLTDHTLLSPINDFHQAVIAALPQLEE